MAEPLVEIRAIELRSVKGRKLSGAIKYSQVAQIGGERGYQETLAPLSLQPNAGGVLLLYSHDPAQLLARTNSGTLKIENTPEELRWEASLPHTRLGDDLVELITRKDITGCSWGF